jgi:spermidine synthase
MSALFEELDYRPTPMGPISLRRRRILSLGRDVFEVKLGEEFLMSSLFTVGEEALATLGLAEVEGDALDVVVGGLGLGHTARAALEQPRVRSVRVVEALDAVIEWHRRGLVPLGAELSGDPRCAFVPGDFFAMAAADGFDPAAPGRRFDAVLLDIDHSPGALLHASHGGFYDADGLRRLARWVRPGGVFAMWSDAGPEEAFTGALRDAFASARAEVVTFDNPLQGREASCTIYVARAPE